MALQHSFLTSGLILLLLAGCQRRLFDNIVSATKTQSFNDIIQETKNSVVLISYGDKKGHGTGFFVKLEGQCSVLTAAHVVRSSQQIKIRPHVDQKWFSTSNIQEISGKDLAVISFSVDGEENCPYTAIKLNNSHPIKLFDTVLMVGYPTREGEARLVLQSSKGEVSNIEDPPLPEGYAISYDMTTVGGMSGAPLINQWGKVVAVHGKTDVEIVSLARSQQSSLSIEQKTKIDEISRRSQRINHFKWGIPIETYLAHESSILTSLEGDRLRENEQYTEAIKSYDQALEIDPNSKYSWYGRGVALKRLERYEEAINSYNKAIEIDPNYAWAWNNRGYASEKLERYEEALKSYNKALEIDSDHNFAINNKRRLLEKLNQANN